MCAPVFHERGYRERYAGRYGVGRALFERAIVHHERAGNLRAACFVRIDLSFQEYLLGAYAEALRAALADADADADADRMGLDLALAWSNPYPVSISPSADMHWTVIVLPLRSDAVDTAARGMGGIGRRRVVISVPSVSLARPAMTNSSTRDAPGRRDPVRACSDWACGRRANGSSELQPM
ncbi:hypothetical protein WME94_07125 [Sorangium sp. So ce429]